MYIACAANEGMLRQNLNYTLYQLNRSKGSIFITFK